MDERRQTQVDRLEDAALNLLVEDYIQAEGEALLKDFEASKQEYMPRELDQQCLKLIDRTYAQSRRRESISRVVKGMGKAVAVIAVVLCLAALVAPPVFGAENLVELLGRWTDEEFSFAQSQQTEGQKHEDYVFQTDHPDLEKIHKTVADLGITQPAVPMYVPQGYTLAELRTAEVMDGVWVFAVLTSGEEVIHISVRNCSKGAETKYLKDSGDAYWLELNGIAHYIFTNEGVRVAAWKTGNLECNIALTDENLDIVEILTSVYTAKALS